jgi:two-component system response regulator AtoC
MQPSEKARYKILVVDDDPEVNKALRLMLQFDGHEVQTANSGKSALAIFEASQFDLIITDYNMPGIMGDELAALMKQKRPSQPIILTSGNFPAEFTDGNLVSGVDYLLNKPVTMSEMRETLLWVLGPYAESRQIGLGAPGPHDEPPPARPIQPSL